MDTAVAVLHSENDFLVMLIINSAHKALDTFVAAEDDGETFLTAPDAEGWAHTGVIRRLRTNGLSAPQKASLRANFIEEQVLTLVRTFHPCEIAINKGVITRAAFSLFGKGWGLGWRDVALPLVNRFPFDGNPAFRYLHERNASVETALLGVLYLAHRHGFDQLTQAEREEAGTANFLAGAGAKPFSLHKNPPPRKGTQGGPNIFKLPNKKLF